MSSSVNLSQLNSIQLQGKADDYLLVPFLQANQTGIAIYRKASAQNELIGILKGGSNLSLSGNYFSFVDTVLNCQGVAIA